MQPCRAHRLPSNRRPRHRIPSRFTVLQRWGLNGCPTLWKGDYRECCSRNRAWKLCFYQGSQVIIMEVLENTRARRFDFDAVVAAIRTSGRFLYMMCEQEKTGPKENGDGRGGDESDENEGEKDADGEPLRRGAGGRCRSRGCCRKPRVRQQPLVPGIGAGVRLFGKHIGEACRTGGFGRPPRRGQLRRFSEPQGCRCSAGHVPPPPLQTRLTCDASRAHPKNTAAPTRGAPQMT